MIDTSRDHPVVAIIGPSACGKSSVVRELHQRGLVRVQPTWTTRPRRSDERRGSLEHRFVTDGVFDELDAIGFFIETVTMFGLPYRYGLPAALPRATGGRVDLVMLRAPLVDRFRAHAPDCTVFQIEDDTERAARRLAARATSADELRARIRDNDSEIIAGRRIADRVFVNNRSVADLVDRVAGALQVEVAR